MRPLFSLLLACALLCAASCGSINSDYELQKPAPRKSGSAGLTVKQWNATGANAQVTQFTLATITNPIPHFYVYVAPNSSAPCDIGMQNTSVLGRHYECQFATNGSPRNWTPPLCDGVVVSDGRLEMDVWNDAGGFGLTKDGMFAIGSFNETDFKRMDFYQYLYGFTWLVRKGVNQVTQAGGEVAPRTSIGTDRSGNLLVFEVDGVENSTPPVGLTNQESALWWIKEGGYNVMNLDGGGSSTVYYNDKVINYPHCQDIPNVWCERPISVITCIK